jgi:hypothetical protein
MPHRPCQTKAMKPLLLVGFMLVAVVASAQLSIHGDSEFRYRKISSDKFLDFELATNYYTIERNISSKTSPVFMTTDPTPRDVIWFARNKPSYYFTVAVDDSVLYSIILNQKQEGVESRFSFTVFDVKSKKRVELPCSTTGEVTELRASEILALPSDTNARTVDMPNGVFLLFDGVTYKIQPYFPLKSEVIALAQNLVDRRNASMMTPDQFIRKQSVGGTLDFAHILSESEEQRNRIFMIDGKAYSLNDYALFLWAQAAHHIGIKTLGEATVLWEEVYGRKLTDKERPILKHGYDTDPKMR